MEIIIELIEFLGNQQGRGYRVLSFILSCTLVIVICIRVCQVVSGKARIGNLFKNLINTTGHNNGDLKSQIEGLLKDKDELGKDLATVEKDKGNMLIDIEQKKTKCREAEKKYCQATEQLQQFKNLCQELDDKCNKKTNVLTQFTCIADEIANALADEHELSMKRNGIYRNLFTYLANILDGARTKGPQVTIFSRHKEDETKLQHYANSADYLDDIGDYELLINISAANKAWRTNEPCYLSDVTEAKAEFEHKTEADQSIVNSTIFCTPIKAGNNEGRRLGVICVTGLPIDAYSQTDQELIMLFATLIYPLIWQDLKANYS